MNAMKWKTWVGNLDGTRRGLVVSTSKVKAAKIAGTSLYDFNRYWSERLPPVEPSGLVVDTLYTKRFDSQDSWGADQCPKKRP